MALQYCNNLKIDDPVLVLPFRRRGKVDRQPRGDSRSVSVILEGTTAPRYFLVSNVRLIVDGEPEEFPPCDGDPAEERRPLKKEAPPVAPAAEAPKPKPPPMPSSPPPPPPSLKVLDAGYEGGIDLSRIYALRRELAAKVAELDQRIQILQIEAFFRKTGARRIDDLEDRVEIAVDLRKAGERATEVLAYAQAQ